MKRLNSKSYTLVTAPAVEPVSLAELKLFAKVDGDTENSLLTYLITSARQQAEAYTQRRFISQTWKLTADFLGEPFPDSVPPGWLLRTEEYLALRLAKGPWQSITHMKTYNIDNTLSTVDAATYTLDAANGRVLLNSGYSWPDNLRDYAAVEVTFVAGYGAAASDVPQAIRTAILMHATAMYENRCADMPTSCTNLLDPYRTAESFGA
jgi:hypothetical protein